MNKTDLRSLFRPIIILFIAINIICFAAAGWFNNKGIDHVILLFANLILFLLTLIACLIHLKALRNNNSYAFVRAVTLASFLKLIVIAVSVAVYFVVAGKEKNIYAVGIAMFFYLLYTLFEVRGAMQLNRNKNARN